MHAKANAQQRWAGPGHPRGPASAGAGERRRWEGGSCPGGLPPGALPAPRSQCATQFSHLVPEGLHGGMWQGRAGQGTTMPRLTDAAACSDHAAPHVPHTSHSPHHGLRRRPTASSMRPHTCTSIPWGTQLVSERPRRTPWPLQAHASAHARTPRTPTHTPAHTRTHPPAHAHAHARPHTYTHTQPHQPQTPTRRTMTLRWAAPMSRPGGRARPAAPWQSAACRHPPAASHASSGTSTRTRTRPGTSTPQARQRRRARSSLRGSRRRTQAGRHPRSSPAPWRTRSCCSRGAAPWSSCLRSTRRRYGAARAAHAGAVVRGLACPTSCVRALCPRTRHPLTLACRRRCWCCSNHRRKPTRAL